MVAYFSCSCKKDDETIGDYLPLKVGTKYLYSIDEGYYEPSYDSIFSKHGKCEWEFIDKTPDTPYVYNVQQTFNGIYLRGKYHFSSSSFEYDTTLINNEISTLAFQENKDRKVKITFPMMYFGSSYISVERFLESSKSDTCFQTFAKEICLSKNIGIRHLRDDWGSSNYAPFKEYTLLNGPYN